jgi:hypothetical protein
MDEDNSSDTTLANSPVFGSDCRDTGVCLKLSGIDDRRALRIEDEH